MKFDIVAQFKNLFKNLTNLQLSEGEEEDTRMFNSWEYCGTSFDESSDGYYNIHFAKDEDGTVVFEGIRKSDGEKCEFIYYRSSADPTSFTIFLEDSSWNENYYTCPFFVEFDTHEAIPTITEMRFLHGNDMLEYQTSKANPDLEEGTSSISVYKNVKVASTEEIEIRSEDVIPDYTAIVCSSGTATTDEHCHIMTIASINEQALSVEPEDNLFSRDFYGGIAKSSLQRIGDFCIDFDTRVLPRIMGPHR